MGLISRLSSAHLVIVWLPGVCAIGLKLSKRSKAVTRRFIMIKKRWRVGATRSGLIERHLESPFFARLANPLMSVSLTPELPETVANTVITPPKDSHDNKQSQLEYEVEQEPTNILKSLELVKLYESQDAYQKSRELYGKLHERFPFYSPLWTIQLKGELERDEFEVVEKLLAECLSGAFANNDLSLWTTYLDYVRRRNNLITGGQEARATVIKAFDLVLEKFAVLEPRSSSFWNDYLAFLEQWKPVNKWEERQRVDMLRSFYKKMLCVPFDNLEKMWSRYTQWEQDVNSLTARKFIGEISADYMKARSAYQEWSNVTKNLKRSSPISLSTANRNNIPQRDATNMHADQLQLWLDWIEWEKTNKLGCSQEMLNRRIQYIYLQAIQYMMFSPEIWIRYSSYVEDMAARLRILRFATQANPDSPSLTFKLAECYEENGDIPEVSKVFENCINTLLLEYHRMTKTEEHNEGMDNALVDRIRRTLTFVYCIYMSTMKKLSGLSAARAVFGKCRKLKNILTHDIYIENAYLEFQNQNDYKTASKVLELGLKYFQDDGTYINKYLDFLILLNRDSQIKTLFETSIEKVQNLGQLKKIYQKMISYESKFGNLDNMHSLEKRFFERFPNESRIDVLSQRFEIQGENLIKKLELTYLIDEDLSSPLPSSSLTTDVLERGLKRHLDTEKAHNNGKKKFKKQAQVPQEILQLLSVLPKRQYFTETLLDPQKLISFLNEQVEISEKQ